MGLRAGSDTAAVPGGDALHRTGARIRITTRIRGGGTPKRMQVLTCTFSISLWANLYGSPSG
jgi:hypothetical protein